MKAKRASPRPWTEDEIEFLRLNAGKIPQHDIASRLCRTLGSVNKKIERAGLSVPELWDQAKIEEVRVLAAKMPARELAKKLGYSDPCALRQVLKRHGIEFLRQRLDFSEDEVVAIIRMYREGRTCQEIGRKLLRIPNSIYQKLQTLGELGAR